jgi:hypothetical protein
MRSNMRGPKTAGPRRRPLIRAVHVKPDRGEVVSLCLSNRIGIDAIDLLPNNGTKILCRTVDGERILRAHLARRPSQRRAIRKVP